MFMLRANKNGEFWIYNFECSSSLNFQGKNQSFTNGMYKYMYK